MQRFGLEIVSEPSQLAITVEQAKFHARIRGRDELDENIEEIIREATRYIEDETMLSLPVTQYLMTLDRFPSYYGTKLYPYDFVNSAFYLPRNPVTAVSSISYVGVDGTTVTLNNSTYQVANKRWPCRILPTSGSVWPFTNYFNMQSVTILFSAGYSTVPPLAQRAVKYLFSHFYENREPTGDKTDDIPYSLKALINKLKYAGYTQW